MKPLAIIGAGGLAREASLLLEEINNSLPHGDGWRLLGFIDEDRAKWQRHLRGYPVLGGMEALAGLPDDVAVICAVAEPWIKRRLVGLAEEQGRTFTSLMAPGTAPPGEVAIGCGVLVGKGCLLTTNIRLGDHVTLNPGCAIGHDASIGAFTTMMWRVNISGAVTIGEGCSLGTATTVLQGLRMGRGCVTGAGAVVIRELPDDCTAVGVPAQVVKVHQDAWRHGLRNTHQTDGRERQP